MPDCNKICVSVYLEKDNYRKLKKIVDNQEYSMARWLAQRVVKIVNNELKKQGSKK